MKKRILSALTAIAIMFSMVYSLNIGALAFSNELEETQNATISVVGTWGNPGKNVEVDICIADNPGILGATITVAWDERLTLISDASGAVFGEMTYTPPSKYIASGTNFLWFGNEVNSVFDGVILKLVFCVDEDVQNNDILPIKVSYINGEIVDSKKKSVTVNINDGAIRAITYIPGDVNGDGRVNMLDLVKLSQYISDGCVTDPEGYNAVVVSEACDVDSNGRINILDLIKLSQYNSDGCVTDPKGYNVVLNPAKLPECVHSHMEKVEARTPTCTEAGNSEYWHCTKCGKYFADADGNKEITIESTVVNPKGHTVVIDAAVSPTYDSTGLTEGKHCSVCNVVLVEQQVVPALKNTHLHSITYNDYADADISGLEMSYDERYGYVVPQISRPGYRFDGWFTSRNYRPEDRIDTINVGSTDTYNLYAHWELIHYDIVYMDTLENYKTVYQKDTLHNNPTTCTIEDEIYLMDPEWSGLHFDYWTDKDGNKITKIEKGMATENLEIIAHWSVYRNRVQKKDNSQILMEKDEETGNYYFICELGVISDVVLNAESTFEEGLNRYRKTGSLPQNIKSTKQLRVQQATAESIAQSMAYTAVHSEEISDVTEEFESKEGRWNLSVSGNVSFNWPFVKAKVSASTSGGNVYIDQTTKTHTEVKVDSSTTQETNSMSTAFSHLSEYTLTEEKSYIIPANMPNGLYEYVFATDVHMYAVVVYDPDTHSISLGTYSLMDYIHTMVMYYPIDYDTSTYSSPLAYGVPVDQICAFIDSIYYVSYDSNGGEGETYFSTFEANKNETLTLSSFEREGYDFAGWSLTPDGEIAYTDGETVKNLAKAGEFITLYAVWTPKKYSAEWTDDIGYTIQVKRIESPYGNAALEVLNSGSVVYAGDVLSVEYVNTTGYSLETTGETLITVSKNIDSSVIFATAILNTYTITYNANGGEGVTDSSVHTYDIRHTLTANAFSRKGWTYVGWNTKADGSGTQYADQDTVLNLTAENDAVIVLYAQWSSHSYFVAYDANGGQGTTSTSSHTYDTSKPLTPNAFYRKGYAFIGWNTNPNGNGMSYSDQESVVNLTDVDSETITLYAMWKEIPIWGEVIDPYTIGQYVANGEYVSNSDGSNRYQVFNSEIPRYCVDPTIIYLPSIDGDISIVTDLGKETYIIGDPSKTYTGINLCFAALGDDETRVLHLKDFNFVSSGEAGAIMNWIDGSGAGGCTGGNIIIDIVGECSISYTANTGAATINLPEQNVTITGSGTLNVYGANGADGQADGENGQDGAAGIQANDVVIDMTGTLKVYGGDGGDGAAGLAGTNGSNADDGNGESGGSGTDGGNGGNGGNGGSAIVAEKLTVVDKPKVQASLRAYSGAGGNGGNGGNGGSGGNGGKGYSPYNFFHATPGNGGKGGDGGNGGNGGNGGRSGKAIVTNAEEGTVLRFGSNAGIGGAGGTCGFGGNGGSAGVASTGLNGISKKYGAAGERGLQGTNGTNGTNGNVIYDVTTAGVYNNADNGNVTHSIENGMLKITVSGEATPGLGGFVQTTSSAPYKVFYHTIVAKVPVGYKLEHASNAIGDGAHFEWMTSNSGTGEFETYVYRTTCGSTGTFNDFGYVYLYADDYTTVSYPVEWYVSYANITE